MERGVLEARHVLLLFLSRFVANQAADGIVKDREGQLPPLLGRPSVRTDAGLSAAAGAAGSSCSRLNDHVAGRPLISLRERRP